MGCSDWRTAVRRSWIGNSHLVSFDLIEVVFFGSALMYGKNSGCPGIYLRNTSGTSMPCKIVSDLEPRESKTDLRLPFDSSPRYSKAHARWRKV